MLSWVQGNLVPNEAGAIRASDRGFQLGDGLFETILWTDRALVRFDLHMARFHDSASRLGLAAPPAAEMLHGAILEMIAANALGDQRCAIRISFSSGPGQRGLPRPSPQTPTLVITATPTPRVTSPAVLRTSRIVRNDTAPTSRHKTLSYIDNIVARSEAADAGADEAIQLNTRGAIAGGAASNVFLVVEGRILTPPISDGALPGTVRAALLAGGGSIEQRSITPADFAKASAAAITNAIQGVRIVSRWDERALDIADARIKRLQDAVAA